MNLSATVARHWRRRGLVAFLLLPIALVFWVIAAAHKFLYRCGVLAREHLPVTVIVVGNITAGGTGKTPLVIFLARELARRGLRPGVVSRGYGGAAREVQNVGTASNPAVVGDEAVLIARRADCPVFVGRDRVAAARALLAANPDCGVIVSDDGLQHHRLARDIEIVVLDERGLGNGLPLPAGPLREGCGRLETVDAVVLNGSAQLPPGAMPRNLFRMALAGEQFTNLRDPSRTCRATELRDKRLHALAGIGNPARFFRQLEALGLHFVRHEFPDHHAFKAADLKFEHADALLMTEKDGVKCETFAPDEAWVLPIEARLDQDFGTWVGGKLAARP